ncbi:ATP-binding protein [Kocuria rhizophila]|uniref:ATP-binding protein n=1 Tax=Kocuria rhizophila TaxID=72000 RepID=A0AAX2SGJ4_KOCRH|nr:ATP-binding protein [Kocuria rhizophila]TFI08092.1 ATP-binding protein [Kocuria rhizophila]
MVDLELDDLFGEVAALALDGPKAVGKTTTAEQRAAGLVKLDSKAVREPVAADPQIILRRPRPLLIDEWQKVPEVWDVVPRAVDEDAAGGQFLLTGSASPQDGTVQHSGAGRIGRLRMRPMTLAERGLETPTVSLAAVLAGRDAIQGESTMGLPEYVEEIVASGFPGMRGLSSRARSFQLDSYLRNAVERDVPEQGLAVRRPGAMMAWLRAYASATSTTASYSQILDAATPGHSDKPARATTESYRQVLASLWLLDPVPAWTPTGSPMTRLGQAPKHHLADPALAARLLGLGADALLGGKGEPLRPQAGSMLGMLFESLVTLCVRVAAQAAEADIAHLRTRNDDHEVDLVVVRPDGGVVGVEVKLAAAVSDSDGKHLRWLRDQLGSHFVDGLIITTGPTAYRRRDGIAVVPLALFGP